MRKVRIHTFGCQMNVYDSERLLAGLVPLGFEATDEDCEADLIILNTCSVRGKPEAKVSSMLGRLAPLKSRNPNLRLAVGGCVGKQHGQELLDRIPYLDLVFGPDQVGSIGELVSRLYDDGGRLAQTAVEADRGKVFAVSNEEVVTGSSAFLSIMKGCNQFCAYCIVPFVRGREVSRDPDEILAQAQALVARGVREITLLGQNVNRYGLDRPGLPSFAQLLRQVHEVPGLQRLTFVTSNPGDCPEELIQCFADLPKLLSFFHLPLQSGSDQILSAMNRRYTRAQYFELVARLRAVRPEMHLSTDLIVGFPGETEAQFQETLSAARQIRWGSAFSFSYSVRPGTAAAKLPDDVPAAEKNRRLQELQEILDQCLHEGLVANVGSLASVLVEGESRRGDGQLQGRTHSNYIVNLRVPEELEGQIRPGMLVKVKIIRPLLHSLRGEALGLVDRR